MVVTVALAGTGLIVLSGAFPALRLARDAPELGVGIKMGAGVVAGLAAYLFLARLRRDGRWSDLLLAVGLAIFAIANVFLAAVPMTLTGGEPSAFASWAPTPVRLLGAVAIAVAAFDARPAGAAQRAAAAVGGAALAAVAAVAAVSAAAGTRLPDPDDPAALGLELASFVLFAAAAGGFARQAGRTGDDLLRWLAVGSVLAALARLHYVLFPPLGSHWISTGDLFRVAFYVALLVGAVREIGRYQRDAAGAAVLEERRRIARDLHDGLAQELAFIAGQAARLRIELLETAAQRALGEARRAIAALTQPLDEPLGAVLADVAEEVAERSGLNLELSIRSEPRLTPDAREDLLRIAREAITNAGRHADARTVLVELANGDGDGLHLRVADDGVGFDPEAVPRPSETGGFGLVSMRERARALGGELRIRSQPGSGTSVEVIVP